MLKTLYRTIVEFVFPLAPEIREFQEMSPSEILKQLPRSEHNIQDVHSLFAYQDDQVKQLIWEIKYYRNEKVARVAGELLAQIIMRNTEGDASYLVMSVPITDRRFRERGFNHTELLTRATLKFLPNNFKFENTTLHKIRHTRKQNSIEDRNERFSNIAGAFSVSNKSKIENQNVVLLDDVVTTGATLGEVKKALLKAGARRVFSFTIAH
ncbi:MAG TPA: phosphoribosyltransferase family protein [Candidatus Nanoarchaeia archaeon]|nr:phosphoribosyltransferase family protein [Candidatus Nanoarchaeia archaeon]